MELTKVAGNEQMAVPGSFLDLPLTVDVHTPAPNSTEFFNAPVHYAVSSGSGLLGVTSGTQQLASFLDTRAVNEGGKAIAKAYLKLPATEGADVTVSASASSASASFVARVNGLASHLKFNGQVGTIVQDSTGYGRTGTLLNGVAAGKGPDLSDALFFDGVDDVLSIGNSTGAILPPGNTSFTISFWLRSATGDATATLLSNRASGAANNGFSIALESGKLAIWSDDSGGGIVKVASSRSIADMHWHKVVVTYSGAEARMYVDSQLVVNASGQVVSNTQDITVAGGLAGWPCFAGRIDEVMFYRGKVLTAAEISAAYLQEIEMFDTDGDGLSNREEIEVYHTDPELKDTDGDNVDDNVEIANGTNPRKAGAWQTSSIYISPGRAGHVFAVEVNGTDEGAIVNLGLKEGNATYGSFTELWGDLSLDSDNTLVDLTAGERLVVGLPNEAGLLDFRAGVWSSGGGAGTPVRQYFVVGPERLGHGLWLAQPNGAFHLVTVGSQVNAADVEPNSPAARFECSAVFDPQAEFWVIDLLKGEKSASNQTNLAVSTWGQNTGQVPAAQVYFFLPPGTAGEDFTLHSRIPGGPEQLQRVTAFVYGDIAGEWTDPSGAHFTTPPYVAAISASAGIGMELWVTRDGDTTQTEHFFTTEASVANNAATWNLQGVFMPSEPAPELTSVTFRVASPDRDFAIEYADGTLSEIPAQDWWRVVEYYDEKGQLASFYYGEISTEVDNTKDWRLVETSYGTVTLRYPVRATDFVGAGPSMFPAPQGFVWLDISAGRRAHELELHQSIQQSESPVRALDLKNASEYARQVTDIAGNILYTLPVLSIQVPLDFDLASPNGSYFWVRDLSERDNSPVDNVGTAENPNWSGRTDLSN